MTQWATQLIPAGSVVVGGLVTGSLTLWGQALVNKGTHKREREARHDAFKVRQREIERDALLALQEALSAHYHVRRRLLVIPRPYPVELRDRYRELQLAMMRLGTQVPDDVKSAVNAYASIPIRIEAESTEERADPVKAFQEAQTLAGRALMRDL